MPTYRWPLRRFASRSMRLASRLFRDPRRGTSRPGRAFESALHPSFLPASFAGRRRPLSGLHLPIAMRSRSPPLSLVRAISPRYNDDAVPPRAIERRSKSQAGGNLAYVVAVDLMCLPELVTPSARSACWRSHGRCGRSRSHARRTSIRVSHFGTLITTQHGAHVPEPTDIRSRESSVCTPRIDTKAARRGFGSGETSCGRSTARRGFRVTTCRSVGYEICTEMPGCPTSLPVDRSRPTLW